MDSIDQLAEELYKQTIDDAEYYERFSIENDQRMPWAKEYWIMQAIRQEVATLRTQRLTQQEWAMETEQHKQATIDNFTKTTDAPE